MLSWAHVRAQHRSADRMELWTDTQQQSCFLSISTQMPTLLSTPSAHIIQRIVYGPTFQTAVPPFS